MTTETLLLLAPEIVLIATAALIYVAGAFVDAPQSWRWVAGVGVVLAAVLLANQIKADGRKDLKGTDSTVASTRRV